MNTPHQSLLIQLTTICVFCVVVIIVAAAVFWIRRCNPKCVRWIEISEGKYNAKNFRNLQRHEYHAVNTSSSSTASKEEQRHAELDSNNLAHDEELRKFQKHLNANKRYRLVTNLGQMGWRTRKQWFLIRDTSLDADRLLTLLEISPQDAISSNATTRFNVIEMLRSLHHPYILPILDVEFWHLDDGNVTGMIIQPLNREGSLRNLIYNLGESPQQLLGSFVDVCNRRKYAEQRRGRGLPFKQVQSLGRQILEALSFLQMRQFPKFYHLHAGNVIIQNGVARLAALENTFFRLEAKQPALNEVSAFGNLLFEMSVGYELNDFSPTSIYRDLAPLIVDVVDKIFNPSPTNSQPSVDTLIRHDLFRRVELRELWRNGAEIAPVISNGCSAFLKKMHESEDASLSSVSDDNATGVIVPESTVDMRHRPLTRTSSAGHETLALIVDGGSSRLF